ncbi:MAG: uroporphyrinogen decarboxylase family protein [Candidatus Brocadiia bacterium]
MTSRERVCRALRFEGPDRPPRDLWTLEYARMPERLEELERIRERFPMDFQDLPVKGGEADRAEGEKGVVGSYVDLWGSRWEVAEQGVIGEVKQPALADWDEFGAYEAPWEWLETTDLSEVNPVYEKSQKFCIWRVSARPFERIQFIRGPENLYYDLATRPNDVRALLDLLHEFYMREIEMWKDHKADALWFMDDWGTQQGLLIAPDMWREMFKPLYRDYVEAIHDQGKFAFFHSDGHIEAIYGDLIEIGLDAINSQLFCMDIEKLGEKYAGDVTFWGEIDRQHLLPNASPEDVKRGVRRVRRALDTGRGGVIAQCEWGLRDPAENIEAVFKAWAEPHPDEDRR